MRLLTSAKKIGFMVGEMKDPRRDLPRAINMSMTTVIIGFALLNASLYAILPMDVIRKNLAVAVVSLASLACFFATALCRKT